jgi:hypothetical protein
MNWVAITSDDLKVTKVAALVEALQTQALGVGQSDPTSDIIADVVARIRIEIKGNAANKLDSDTTKIPQSLKSLASRMIVREMQSRLQIALMDDEKTEQQNDLDFLKRISRGEVPIDEADDPTDGAVQSTSVSPSISGRNKQFSHCQQDGI